MADADGEPPPGLLDELASMADEHSLAAAGWPPEGTSLLFCYRAVTRHDTSLARA